MRVFNFITMSRWKFTILVYTLEKSSRSQTIFSCLFSKQHVPIQVNSISLVRPDEPNEFPNVYTSRPLMGITIHYPRSVYWLGWQMPIASLHKAATMLFYVFDKKEFPCSVFSPRPFLECIHSLIMRISSVFSLSWLFECFPPQQIVVSLSVQVFRLYKSFVDVWGLKQQMNNEKLVDDICRIFDILFLKLRCFMS